MESITVILYKYGVLATCITILLEYACFPISSEIVLPFSGVIAKLNNINLFILIVLSVIAGIIGSSICYTIGTIFGEKCINYITNKFPKTNKAFNKCYNFFEKFGSNSVLFARLIPLCRTYISFVAGAMKQPFHTFIIFSGIGIILWNTILISIGYFLGENWQKAIRLYESYKHILLGICLFVFCIIIFKKLRHFFSNEQ